MVNIRQVIFSFIGSQLPVYESLNDIQNSREASVAIVGAGSAGLAMLKALKDLPEHGSWNSELFEERENIGGIWLPDPYPAPPPIIPKTPLYPALHANTPVPMMTYPNFPFLAGTHLYPSHEHIESYHVRYAQHYNLMSYIRFNHRVLNVSWIGSSHKGLWNITVSNHNNETQHKMFRRLVVATGNNHIPRIPTWPGQDEWLASTANTFDSRREIEHSAWYRGPKKYTDQSVLIVGHSASGEDAAFQISTVAANTYISIRSDGGRPFPSYAIRKPEISHFTRDSVVFVDNTETIVDSVLLATGYELRKPFLDTGNALITNPKAHSKDTYTKTLMSNTRYIFPLYRHIFSLSPLYPTTALSFIGLPSHIANCPSDLAQAIFVAHAIRNPDILPSREQMLQELATQEQSLKDEGLDPYIKGHRLPDNTRASDYQDELIDLLVEKGVVEDNGQKFVEEWRRKIYGFEHLKRGWKHIKALGTGDEWVRGVNTEEEWSDLMERVNEWQKRYEEGLGRPGTNLDLPLELLPQIVSYILRPNQLAIVCLVDKTFYDAAIPWLYNKVTVFPWHKEVKTRVVQLFATLADCPQLAKHVQHLVIRDFPKSLSFSADDRAKRMIDNVLQGLKNCCRLRACTWTRDGSLTSQILEALIGTSSSFERHVGLVSSTAQYENHGLKELEINGHDEGNYAPTLLLGFRGLERISLIMPTASVISVLSTWTSLNRGTLRRLTLICKSSSVITDEILISIAPSLDQLDEFHLAGCPKVTHQSLLTVLSYNAAGIVGLRLEGLSRHFDMTEFSLRCTASEATRRLRSITLTLCRKSQLLDTWLKDVLLLLAPAPLEVFQIYAQNKYVDAPVIDRFYKALVTTHGHRLIRFAVHRMWIGLDVIKDICERCVNLEQLFVVVPPACMNVLASALAHGKKLRIVHVNFPVEIEGESEIFIPPGPIVDRCSSTLVQFGCNTRVWQITNDVRFADDGSISTSRVISSYDSPDIPEAFLVVRT